LQFEHHKGEGGEVQTAKFELVRAGRRGGEKEKGGNAPAKYFQGGRKRRKKKKGLISRRRKEKKKKKGKKEPGAYFRSEGKGGKRERKLPCKIPPMKGGGKKKNQPRPQSKGKGRVVSGNSLSAPGGEKERLANNGPNLSPKVRKGGGKKKWEREENVFILITGGGGGKKRQR